MPTMKPEDVLPSKSEKEYKARIKALHLVNKLLDCVDGWAYATRSHMPNGVDYTEFLEALTKVRSFFNSRPDWTNDIINRLYERCTETDLSKQEEYVIAYVDKDLL